MKIGLDILGGDYAPKATILGAIEAQQLLSEDQKLVLFGDEQETKILIEKAGVILQTLNIYMHPKISVWVNTLLKRLHKNLILV